LNPITQGSFILSYIGELITDEEAERREDTYLFNLDLKVREVLILSSNYFCTPYYSIKQPPSCLLKSQNKCTNFCVEKISRKGEFIAFHVDKHLNQY